MRTIIARIDERGRTEASVEPDPETGRFLKKREFMSALRAIRLAYRRAIKEYRKQLTRRKSIKELNDEHQEKERDRGEPIGTTTGGNESSEQATIGTTVQTEKRSGVIRFGKES